MKIAGRARLALSLLLTMAACGGSNATSDGGVGDDAGSTGGSTGGGAGGATFYFAQTTGRKVGAATTEGKELWTTSLDAKPLGLAAGAGALWVLVDTGAVVRIDTSSHAVTATTPVAKTPSFIAFASGAVWVTDDTDGAACASVDDGPAKLLRLDPATSAITSQAITATTTFACNRFDGLATDGTVLFALVDNAFGLARVDPATKGITRVALGTGAGYGTGHVTYGGGKLWVINTNAKTILDVDSASLAVKSTTPVATAYRGERMVAGPDALYLDGDEKVLRVTAATPTQQGEFRVAPIDALAFHGSTLFVATSEVVSPSLVGYDPTTLAQTRNVEGETIGSYDALVFAP